MKKHNKDVLKATLFALIAIFIMIGIAGLLFADHKRKLQKEQQKRAAIEALESIPTVTPTPVATATPTPTPVPTQAPTPTPAITRAPAFSPNDYYGTWYSKNGLVSFTIEELTLKSVTYSFAQASDESGKTVSEASGTAKVAGNAAQLEFTDSYGNTVSGSVTFDQGKLYLQLATTSAAGDAKITPEVKGVMTREKSALETVSPTVIPEAEKDTKLAGDYIFPESDSRYLEDEELEGYSSSELELAKNEIYARHGRKFVTKRIADYFNSKSWYQGTVDAQTFDAQQNSIFNVYEVANIEKIAEKEAELRSQGK